VFGWKAKLINPALAAAYRRGRSVVEPADQVRDERREAVRTVSNAIADTMANAENERTTARLRFFELAIEAANRANATVNEVDDEEARRLVLTWKAEWDTIPKDPRYPTYPQPAWDELKASAQAAQERLGVVLRELLDRQK